MNTANIFAISAFLLIQLITAKPQYSTYNQYGTYPYYVTQGITYNPAQNLAPKFSNLGGTALNPLYSALGFNTNTGYAGNGYYNNGYSGNTGYGTNQANQGNQIGVWPFVMGSSTSLYSSNGYNTPSSYYAPSNYNTATNYNTPNWYNSGYNYK